MKKLIVLLCWMLALSAVLCGCQTPPPAEENTTPAVTEQKINGIWYSEEYQTVLDLTDPANPVYYRLRIGFYEYESRMEAVGAQDGNVITLTFEDGVTISWTFDPNAGTLTLNHEDATGTSYERVGELPTEYQAWIFADYASMDCASLITLGSIADLVYPTDAEDRARKELFDSYYYYDPDATPPTVTDRTVAQMGDYVCVDYTGYLDGVAFQGGAAQDSTILVSANSGYIPGFAEGIAGHEVGKTFDVNVTFPENYGQASLAGKEVVFTMTLDAIYDTTLPDDKIAEFSNNEFTTYSEMLAKTAEQYAVEDLWGQLLEKTTCESMPEAAYGYFYQYYVDTYHYYAYYYGISYEELLGMYSLTDSALVAQAKSMALNYMAAFAVLEEYDLEVTDEVFNETLDLFAKDLMESGSYTYDEAKAHILGSELTPVQADAAHTTVMRWLIEQVRPAEG